nr:class F sortase [Nocardioides panaciterrulae]
MICGLVAWFLQAPGSGTTAQRPGSAESSASTGATGAATSGAAPEAAPAAWVPGAPRRVVIPALHVDAPVLPIKAPGGILVPPSDPQELGWWAGGARPGAARGTALVTGHTVHTGGGALDDLETLRRGDRVLVRTDRGRIHYVVKRVAVYSKGAVAKHARRLFSQRVRGRLVLVTCEDWNGERYLSNVVVVATPVAE